MSIFQSLFLGAVQGISEFFPISSSGHLILLPWLFKWPKHSLDLDIILHLGSLIALSLYFGKYWIKLIRAGVISVKERTISDKPERKIFWLIAVSSVPSAIIGVLLKKQAETVFRNPLLVSITMGLFAILFLIVEHFSKKEKDLDKITYIDAFTLGILQVFSVVPGISRAGITIASGLALKLKREAAAEFSFLISFPVILGAMFLKLKDILRLFGTGNLLPLFAGLIAAVFCGMLAIKYLLSYVKRHGFGLFIAYRLILCLIVLSAYMLRR